MPGVAIHVAQGLEIGCRQPEVHGLGLIDPLLAASRCIHDPLVVDAERGEILHFDVLRDPIDVLQLAVEILKIVDHILIPQAAGLEVADEVVIEDGEVAGEVGLHEEVLVGGLNTRAGAGDVGDRRSRRDGEHVAVAHAVLGDLFTNRSPVHAATTFDVDGDAALFFENIEGVLREEATIPFRAFVARIGAPLCRDVG